MHIFNVHSNGHSNKREISKYKEFLKNLNHYIFLWINYITVASFISQNK